MIGSTDGYSNGRDDVYLVVAPSPQVGNNEMFTNVEANIIEEAVWVQEFTAEQPMAVYPHPVRDAFSLESVHPQATWSLSDAKGRLVLQGMGRTGNACALSPGMYVLRVNETNEAIPVWVVR
jgi:hypothetical protein